MMTTMQKVLLAVFLLSPMIVSAESSFDVGQMAPNAPRELRHWEQLVGQWSMTEESLCPDGSGWVPTGEADWDFRWAFGGWGIQDEYFSPPRSVQIGDEATRLRGINLRIFNTAENRWVSTWLTTASTRPMNMTATSSDTVIVLLMDTADPAGYFNRITFFDMSATRFEWKMERSKNREDWEEVYRIHAARRFG